MIKKTSPLTLAPVLAILLLAFQASPLPAQHNHGGQGGMHDHGGSPRALDAPALDDPAGPSAVLVVRGVIKAINLDAGTVVLDHEAIPALNWDRMVMEFPVADTSVLEGLDPEDEVRFDLKVTGMGPGATYVIVDMEEVD
ncbi:MAG: copper-binding protein [Deltaproteobacteria bacterium]|jgi:Cu/Ag efflux protein CusF|nr:copper-binding protein [Deltaproteobacteria bacterium]